METNPNPTVLARHDVDVHEERLTTSGGLHVVLAAAVHEDHRDLHAAFSRLVADDEGYPHAPDRPLSREEFESYWIEPASHAFVARQLDDGALVGAYTMKPNGVGRAAHVANAGYFVVKEQRNRGLGEALLRHSMKVARAAGYDAMQFNFVFESNPARRLYERLGFEVVGRVPEVIDGEAVCLYWRRL
jgi:ribosomal protein S18 acetylase RimI-like enzyme